MDGFGHTGVLVNSFTVELYLQYPIIRVVADGTDIAGANWCSIHYMSLFRARLHPAKILLATWRPLPVMELFPHLFPH